VFAVGKAQHKYCMPYLLSLAHFHRGLYFENKIARHNYNDMGEKNLMSTRLMELWLRWYVKNQFFKNPIIKMGLRQRT
jgi:hypothetical protein